MLVYSGWIGMFTGGTIWILTHGHVSPVLCAARQAVACGSGFSKPGGLALKATPGGYDSLTHRFLARNIGVDVEISRSVSLSFFPCVCFSSSMFLFLGFVCLLVCLLVCLTGWLLSHVCVCVCARALAGMACYIVSQSKQRCQRSMFLSWSLAIVQIQRPGELFDFLPSNLRCWQAERCA